MDLGPIHDRFNSDPFWKPAMPPWLALFQPKKGAKQLLVTRCIATSIARMLLAMSLLPIAMPLLLVKNTEQKDVKGHARRKAPITFNIEAIASRLRRKTSIVTKPQSSTRLGVGDVVRDADAALHPDVEMEELQDLPEPGLRHGATVKNSALATACPWRSNSNIHRNCLLFCAFSSWFGAILVTKGIATNGARSY